MSRQYDTFEKKSQTFTDTHQPTESSKGCCCACVTTPLLAVRFLLRNAIPLILGLGAGMLIEFLEREFMPHDNDTLLEISDLITCSAVLLIDRIVDYTLNCCWPANPYQKTGIFQTNADDDSDFSLEDLEENTYNPF